MGKRENERRKYWQSIIAEQQASGKSVRVFCRERDLGEHSFYAWRQRLREEKKPVAFALVGTEPSPQVVKFELTLASGEVLRIPADVASLRVVFEALRATR
jgi:transposase-like protein